MASEREFWENFCRGVDRMDLFEKWPGEKFADHALIGLFQAVAPWPGISRSGSTIVGGLLMGLKREAAANFSFYIAVPALLGATVLMLKDLLKGESTGGVPLLWVLAGSAVAFVVGVAALRGLLKIVVARKLVWFAWYVLALAAVTIVVSLRQAA
jgi:undecaprenyl-diphosphatase